jgi:uroporphyrinogen decarboxylase
MNMNHLLNRRAFLKAAGAVTFAAGCGQSGGNSSADSTINKRDAMLSLLDSSVKQDYIPAAFFIHFDKVYQKGQPAVDKHMEYFRYTGMDFVKIQFENAFPGRADMQRPSDWANMPLYARDFYANQLDIVKGLVKAGKPDALVLQTLYSPYMCAAQTLRYSGGNGKDQLTEQIKENPEAVKKGIEIVAESLMIFVKECIKLGVDGFYASTQGGEAGRFTGTTLFEDCVKPYDLYIMNEINSACQFNILHVCDYDGKYDDLSPFTDYPGQVVNVSQALGDGTINPQDVSDMFRRPFMGGINKRGRIVDGSSAEIEATVNSLLKNSSQKFIMGADCTLPGDINWENIRKAISTAHNYTRV